MPIKNYSNRVTLADEMCSRYGTGTVGFSRRCRFWRKKYGWALVVGGAKFLKRSIDVIGSFTLLLLLSPLFVVAALLIKLNDGGPVLYWQKRVGKWGREFPYPKFRTVRLDAVRSNHNFDDLSLAYDVKAALPLTWIGRTLRATHIDELPQLVCVLNGEMSLVGPRPPTPSEVALYTLLDRRLLDVTPGLTCIRRVSGHVHIIFERQLELDKQYVESQSFWGDIKLLFKTIMAVLLGRGIY